MNFNTVQVDDYKDDFLGFHGSWKNGWCGCVGVKVRKECSGGRERKTCERSSNGIELAASSGAERPLCSAVHEGGRAVG